MAEIQLTREQAAAVTHRGRSLLVSAAAGSGKTRVLVERLFRYIVEDGCQVDDFLIITYTRAAAAELRGKILSELNQRLARQPGNRHLQRQLLRVYQADIKTVDAFCAALLRENIHLLRNETARYSLTADFRVLDEEQAQLLRLRVLQRVLDTFYTELEQRPGARLLADTMGAGRDDRKLPQLVLLLHEKLQSHAKPAHWLAAQQQVWQSQATREEPSVYEGLLLEQLAGQARFWGQLLEKTVAQLADLPAVQEKYALPLGQTAQALCSFAVAAQEGWDQAGNALPAFPRLPPVKAGEADGAKALVKTRWELCKDAVKDWRAMLATPASALRWDMTCTAPAMLALLQLVADFSRAYQTEKLRRNVADFSDQEHYAIDLLTEPDGSMTPLGRTVAARYREVLVDEFQDTNEVQNRIFDLVSQNGEQLFTVGDVKQSIYRFRLADPTIFLERYRAYAHWEQAQEGEPCKILLSQNFRSRSEILDAVNFVFENILSVQAGELDYGEAEKLRFGAEYYLPRTDCQLEYHYIDLPRQTGEQQGRVARTDIEAEFVAQRITQLIQSGFSVQDGEGLRPVRQEDIVILMRSPGPRIAAFRRALTTQGLGCVAEQGEDYFSCMEVAVVFSLLEVIDNPRQDVPLISVLRSPLFGFSPDMLARIRVAAPKGDFYTALTLWGEPEGESFLQALSILREAAVEMGVSRLLWHINTLHNLLGLFGAMSGGRQRRENLLTLFRLAERFESGGSRGVFDFVTHLRNLMETEQQPQSYSGTTETGVRLMSIHKSKGLEFPVVILADLAKRFNRSDLQAQVLVHPTLGLGPLRVDLELGIAYDTVARQALARRLEVESLAEELRVLYVALTRPKEKLILVDCRTAGGNLLQKRMAMAQCPALPEAVQDCNSLGEWLLLPLLCRPESAPLWQLAQLEQTQTVTRGPSWEVHLHAEELLAQRPQTRSRPSAREQSGPVASFVPPVLDYPYAAAVTLPAKLTATQLKGRAKDEEIAHHAALPPRLRSWREPLFLGGERPLDSAARGTAIHLLLQHLNFSADTSAGLNAELERLREGGLLTQQQLAAVEPGQILRFLGSALAAEIRQSPRVEREYRFSILVPASDYVPGLPPEDEVLLQGVVDCFFETEDGLTVVDFKTDAVSAATVAARAEEYRGQIQVYSRALAEVLGRPVTRRALYFFTSGDTIFL